MTSPKARATTPRTVIPKTTSPAPRVPTKRLPHAPSTMTPKRLSTIITSVLAGDTLRASCGAAGVPVPTYSRWLQLGNAAINEARTLTGEDDIEGAIWYVIDELGGPDNGKADAPYWTEPPPPWWPKSLELRWLNCVLVMIVYWARSRSEQMYRQTVTRAATQGDWKAAEFMLTHSFGWSKTERVEVTGADGGPVQVQGDEDATLAALALLAERRKAIGS